MYSPDRVTECTAPKMPSANGMQDKRSNIVTVPMDLSEMGYANASLYHPRVTSGIIVACMRVAFPMKGLSLKPNSMPLNNISLK